MQQNAVKRSNQKRINILLVNKRPLIRYGLRSLLCGEKDMEVIAEVDSLEDASDALTRLRPDVVFADAYLERSGLRVIADVKKLYRELFFILISWDDNPVYVQHAFNAGVSGYLDKNTLLFEYALAVRGVCKNEIYVNESMRSDVLQYFIHKKLPSLPSELARLTTREMEILRLIGLGEGTRRIAESLHRSVKTIDAHRANMRKKLGLRDGVELVRYAIRWVDHA